MTTSPQSAWVRRSGILSAVVVFLACWFFPIGRGPKAWDIWTLVTNSELPAEWRSAFWFSAVIAFFVYGCIAALVGLGVQLVLYLFFRPKRNGWRPGGDCQKIIFVSLILLPSVTAHAQRATTLRPEPDVPSLRAEIAKTERIIVGKVLSIERENRSGMGAAKVEVLDVWKGSVDSTNLEVRLPYFEIEDGHDYLLLLGPYRGGVDGRLDVTEISHWSNLRERIAGKSLEDRVITVLDDELTQVGGQLARLSAQRELLTAIIKAHVTAQRRDTNSLRIVVVPSEQFIRLKESFKVELRVENPTATNVSVRVMNCSWSDHWMSSNNKVFLEGWDCPKNLETTVEIAPGKAYTNQANLVVMEPPPVDSNQPQLKGWLSFRMGFTPIGSPRTFWSEEVALKVIP